MKNPLPAGEGFFYVCYLCAMSDAYRTEIKIQPSQHPIDHTQKIITIGSCFSQVIGQRMMDFKFDTFVNPFGTIYNPISILRLLGQPDLDEDGIIENNGVYLHYDLHSQLRAKDRKTLQTVIRERNTEVWSYLQKADWLVITLGTAFVYELKDQKRIVANCHKMPSNHFEKRMLGMKEMIAAFDTAYAKLKQSNPELKILLTVSPVRHIKDGIAENTLSKSLLRVFCDYCVQSSDQVFYFPSYEIMVDDLRDYRFYKQDLIHPNVTAEEYIWSRFVETYCTDSTRKILDDWSKILDALHHRPFNPASPEHQQFLEKQITKARTFEGHFNIARELAQFQKQLI